MIKALILGAILCLTFTIGCSKGNTVVTNPNGGSSPNSSTLVAETGNCTGNGDGNQALPTVTGSNVMTITVNGTGVCSFNQPCTSVTICTPGTGTCQTITDILVDTGSYGLRIFNSAISGVSLTQLNNGSSLPMAECAAFGSANAWGPVKTADVKLGGESAVTMNIQVIDNTFGTVPAACQTPFAPVDTPANAGFNGILGVGLGQYDCGTSCAASASNGVYYACTSGSSGATCTGAALVKTSQVVNPVFKLPTDNNGVIIQLPSISPNGMTTVTGNLILGIGTQSNNAVTGAPTVFATDSFGNFSTVFAGVSMTNSFIDSGSNGLFFPQVTQTPTCTDAPDFYCPSASTCLAGTMSSPSGTIQQKVSFWVDNADTLVGGSANAFNSLAGTSTDSASFDWGLPFFYGRTVYTGISGKTSSLGIGPYWAF